jgi:hypothetical protein
MSILLFRTEAEKSKAEEAKREEEERKRREEKERREQVNFFFSYLRISLTYMQKVYYLLVSFKFNTE